MAGGSLFQTFDYVNSSRNESCSRTRGARPAHNGESVWLARGGAESQMKNRNFDGGALALIFGCLSLGALAQNDGLEVTLQVLDDISAISGVLMAVEQVADRREPEGRPAQRPEKDSPAPAPSAANRESALGRELDREEESESELEDFDVPEAATP